MTAIFRHIATLFILGMVISQPAYAQFGSFFGPDKTVAEQRQDILIRAKQP